MTRASYRTLSSLECETLDKEGSRSVCAISFSHHWGLAAYPDRADLSCWAVEAE